VTAADGTDDEFLTVALHALQTSNGTDALDQLGWFELLDHLHDPELRPAVFALFRAQGRGLANSPALGALLAHPYLDATRTAPGTVVATLPHHSPTRGPITIAVGDIEGARLLIDRPGHGAWVIDSDQARLHSIDIPGRLLLHEVEVDLSRGEPTISESDAATARHHSTQLGRLAIAHEILGAAETAVEMAVDYAALRRQFGQPIGSFQAVRHLLAWAKTDCVALDGVVTDAVRLHRAAPPNYDQIVKALAGRNGRRACQHTLQVLGGIGFTADHDHHHLYSRVLTLDALLTSSADLTNHLGQWLRTTSSDPRYPATTLHHAQP
jgi:hypothetical protein